MHILICDDEPITRTILRQMLESSGHTCAEAEDGAAAWHLIEASPPDVIISDWDMPSLDGLGLCERVRKLDHQNKYIYFILLTAKDRQQNLILAVRHGADDYLVKPCDPQALTDALKKADRLVALHQRLAQQRSQLSLLKSTPLT
jgi:DNA-binding response OmpR family regulator